MTDGSLAQRVRQIFDAATELLPQDRADFVVRECGDNADLAGKVMALLGHHDRANSFLERPPQPPPSSGWDVSNVVQEGLALGTIVDDRYRVDEFIGGGMGAVYRAFDTRLQREVALKTIANADISSTDRVVRFKQEALVTAALSHPNVVCAYDAGTWKERPYLITELLNGETLRDRIGRGGISSEEVRGIAMDIAAGLMAAHDARLVHRDLKPENVILTSGGPAKILDFGVAKLAEQDERRSAKTITGTIVGTSAYLAPEQIVPTLGKQHKPIDVDGRTDLFALGSIVFEMLTGAQPFGRGDVHRTHHAILEEPPPDTLQHAPDVPAPMVRIVMRLLEKDPDNRIQSAADARSAFAAARDTGDSRTLIRRRLIWLPVSLVALIGVAFASLMTRRPAFVDAPRSRSPVSVLIADLDNQTGDRVFDGALEQPLMISMEGASFVTAYSRSDARNLARQQVNGTRLDRQTAQLIAKREGITYVLAGSVNLQRNRLILALDLIDGNDGARKQHAQAEARNKDEMLNVVGRLAKQMREGMGDPSPSVNAETFTTTSLEASKAYSEAQEMAKAGHDDDALQRYRQAIALDPQFGRAYSGLAVSSQRLGRIEEADAAWSKARALIDRMSDRERLRTLGAYYLGSAHNYQKAVETYAELVKQYPSDSAGFGNLALAHFYLRDFSKALEEGRQAVAIDPNNLFQRNNVALYAMYAGDFGLGAAEAKQVIARNLNMETAYLPIVMEAALTKSDLATARESYARMAAARPAGASLASIGMADLAMYRGDLDAARTDLQRGLEQDRAANNTAGLAVKQLALAETYAGKVAQRSGVQQADAALRLSRRLLSVAVPAARLLALGGQVSKARTLAAELDAQLSNQYRAYSKIILAEIALSAGQYAEAIERLDEAIDKADLWLARFDRGVAYVNAEHYVEAITEFEMCEKRRGEATALFFDDVPTLRYLAPLPYWKGRAYEGNGSRDGARAEYTKYLALRSAARTDPLAVDAQRRLKSLE